MIRPGKYTVGGQEVEVANLNGGRQSIRIGNNSVVFNENGYEIDVSETQETKPEAEASPERKTIFGGRTK